MFVEVTREKSIGGLFRSTILKKLKRVKKEDGWKNIPEKSSTTIIGERISCRYSMSTIWIFGGIENKKDVFRGKHCMEKPKIKLVTFEKKKLISLKSQEYVSYLNQTSCHICKKKFEDNYTAEKNYRNIKSHCHFTGKCRLDANSICNLKYNAPKGILAFFNNGLKYYY